jgi:hypothetical protein
MPRWFRGEAPPSLLPGDVHKYKPRTVFEEYRVLAIVFGIIAVALTAYFIKWMVLAPKKPPPPVQSVYIETVPPQAPPARDPPKVP